MFLYQVNTFQCILASSHNGSFAIFVYDNIQWPTSGGEALAGINAGDGANHITIPGSLTPSISNIEGTSNIDVPGIWVFRVGEGNHMYMYVT